MEKATLHRGLNALWIGHFIILVGAVALRLPAEIEIFDAIAWILLIVGSGTVAIAFSRLAPLHTGYRIGVLAFMVTVFSVLMYMGLGENIRGMQLLRTLSIGAEMLCTIRATNTFLMAGRRSDLVRKGRAAFYIFLASVLTGKILQIIFNRFHADAAKQWGTAVVLVLMFSMFIFFLWKSSAWFGSQTDDAVQP